MTVPLQGMLNVPVEMEFLIWLCGNFLTVSSCSAW